MTPDFSEMGLATYPYFYELEWASPGWKVPAGAPDLSGGNNAIVAERPLIFGNLTFTTQEGVSIDESGDNTFSRGRYVGTVTFDGSDYPVFRSGRTFYVGSDTPLSDTPRSRIDRNDSSPVCFLAGTLIATPSGERPIETLSIGELVSTPGGPQAVKFLARTTRPLNALRATGKMPIRVSAGALGVKAPHQDLYLTSSHALLLEDHLVEAGALLNGNTIEQLTDHPDLFLTYYNIELERHDLIQANGLQAESYFANYRANGFSRDSWDNYEEYVARYGQPGPMEELPMPRIPFARQLPASLRLQLQLNQRIPSLTL